MAKIKVTVTRDENLFPRHIEIQRGKNKLKIKQVPSPLGDSYSLHIEGKKEALPSFSELYNIVNAKRIDRIGTIDLIDVVGLISLINEITHIGTIDTIGNLSELTTIRDLTYSPKSLIQNPLFLQGKTGWNDTYSNIIITQTGLPATYMAWFPDLTVAMLDQRFPIPIGVDWITEFYLSLRSNLTAQNLIRVTYSYSDKTSTSEVFQVAGAGWEKKTLSPTAGKYMEALLFDHLVTYRECGITSIYMRF